MMDYHELIDALTDEDNPNVLDYINGAIEMLEHLCSVLRAANARCETLSKMLTEYQDELIPGYRERAEKAEAQLSQYTTSGLEPCDYTAMRSVIDGEKEARQSLAKALRALEKSNARAEKAEHERDAAVRDLKLCAGFGDSLCHFCKTDSEECSSCISGTRWQWRGPQEE